MLQHGILTYCPRTFKSTWRSLQVRTDNLKGLLITREGVKSNPVRYQILAGYNRRFTSNFAKLSKPLTNLLQKDTPFHFVSEYVKAF